MAYEETASEKAKRQAKEAKWKSDAKVKEEKADYEAIGSRGNAARKGMEEGKTNPMGDTYKKGGKIMSKKTKRYDEGGFATEEGENKNIGDDTRARAMAAIAAGGVKDEEPTVAKAKPSFKAKAKDAGFTSAETKGGAALMYRKDRKMAKGGSASSRADGCAVKGKTRGRMV